eukprot:TRINITY_DN66088_c5_g4_i1.p1 TRINITY_DN66088_c5_g4~~TRINITY_DN66088_c5_g4_i1.p1  ORF type:complete len:905 (+),score=298.01 TRINITY_DN66088_c5_g4_i1:25-2739(+)
MPRSCSLCMMLLLASAAAAAAGDCWSAGGPTGTNVLAYYVDPTNGNDANAGTKAAPLKTLRYALYGDAGDGSGATTTFAGSFGSTAANKHIFQALDGRDVFVCLMAGAHDFPRGPVQWRENDGGFLKDEHPPLYAPLQLTWSQGATQLGMKSFTLQGEAQGSTTVRVNYTNVQIHSAYKPVVISDVTFEGVGARIMNVDVYTSHFTVSNADFKDVLVTASLAPLVCVTGQLAYDPYPFEPMKVTWTNVNMRVLDTWRRRSIFSERRQSIGIRGGATQITFSNVQISGLRPSHTVDQSTTGSTGGGFMMHAIYNASKQVSIDAWAQQSFVKLDQFVFSHISSQSVRGVLDILGAFGDVEITHSNFEHVKSYGQGVAIVRVTGYDVFLTSQHPKSIGQLKVVHTDFVNNNVGLVGGYSPDYSGVLYSGDVNHTSVQHCNFTSNFVEDGAAITLGGWKATVSWTEIADTSSYSSTGDLSPSTLGPAVRINSGALLNVDMRRSSAVTNSLAVTFSSTEFACNYRRSLWHWNRPDVVSHPVDLRGELVGTHILPLPTVFFDASTKVRTCPVFTAGGYATRQPTTKYENRALLTGVPCPAGHDSYAVATTTDPLVQSVSKCKACAAGKYSSFADDSCVDCTWGKYSNDSGATSCTACPIGKFSSSFGQSTCLDCPPGRFGDEPELTICGFCLFDAYQDQAGQTTCKDCSGTTNSENTSCSSTSLGWLAGVAVGAVALCCFYGYRAARRKRRGVNVTSGSSSSTAYQPLGGAGTMPMQQQQQPPPTTSRTRSARPRRRCLRSPSPQTPTWTRCRRAHPTAATSSCASWTTTTRPRRPWWGCRARACRPSSCVWWSCCATCRRPSCASWSSSRVRPAAPSGCCRRCGGSVRCAERHDWARTTPSHGRPTPTC